MEINKAKQKKKLQKKIIPLAMAAVLTVQGTSVPVWGGVSDNNSLGSTYRVTKRAIVADATAKKLTLEANKKVKITATGYTVGSGMEEPYTGAYVFTTNGTQVADANIEIEGVQNADITLKDCHLTSTQNTVGANKGLLNFSGGKVNLKLVGTNSVAYTGSGDTYSIGSKNADEDLSISGDGSLYLKNVSLKTEASKIEIEDSKVYCDKTIKAVGELKLTGKSILAVDTLDLDNSTYKLVLDGDVVAYFKNAVGGGIFIPEFKKGVVYRGTTVTVNSNNSVKLVGGVSGVIYGNPNISDLIKPEGNSEFTIEVVADDVTVNDVEFTGKEANPEVTVKVNRHIVGEKILKRDEHYIVTVDEVDKSSVGTKKIEISSIVDKGYIGKINKTFEVKPKNIETANVSANLKPWDYNGEERKITIDSVTLGDVKLTENIDYVVTGNKATNAGEYTLEIEGKGNYGGKIERKWKINKASLDITEAVIAPKTYNGNTDAEVTAVTLVGIKADTLIKGKDYDVTGTFSDNNVGTNKTVTVKVTLKDTENANNYELDKDTLTLTGQEITKGKFEQPRIAGTRYLDDDKPDEKFKYVVSEDEKGKFSEYQMDGTAEDKWQNSNVFKNIEPDSTHTFYMRRKAAKNMNASEPVSTSFTFNKINNPNKPVIKFKVTNSKNAGKKKITITTAAGVEYKFDSADYSGNGVKDNLDPNVPVNIKARFKATKTRHSSSEAEQTVDVHENTYKAPAPKLEEGTYYVDSTDENKFEYKVKTVETAPAGKTYEYSKDLVHWITPAVVGGTVTFGAIEPKSTVTFYARVKAEGEDGAGIQGSRTVTFKKLKRTDSPVIVATVGGIKGDKTVTVSAIKYARYKFGDENWQDSNVKEHIAGEKIRVGIYIQETTTHEASEQVFKEIVLNEKEDNGSSNNGGGTGGAGNNGGTNSNGGSGSTGDNGNTGSKVPVVPAVPEAMKEHKQDDKKTEESKSMDNTDNIKEGIKPVTEIAAESVSKNKAEANVSSDDIKEALEAAKESEKNIVRLKVTAPKGIKSVDVKLEEGVLGSLIDSAIKAFEVTANKVKVQFENKALALIDKKSKGDVALSIASVTKLSAKEKKIAGKRPVYNISLKAGETKITNLGEGKVKISIPYNKPVSEKASGLYATYLNKKGESVRIKASYNAKNKTLTFSTKYLTKYVVGYKAPKKNK